MKKSRSKNTFRAILKKGVAERFFCCAIFCWIFICLGKRDIFYHITLVMLSSVSLSSQRDFSFYIISRICSILRLCSAPVVTI